MNALLLDAGGWLLALQGDAAYAEALEDCEEAIVPGLVLAEVDHHLRHRRGAMHRLLAEISDGRYVYEPPTKADLERAREIDVKFKQLAVGLVDASIVALAERLEIRRLLTIDADFVALRFGPKWNLAFELVVPPVGRSR